MGNQKTKNVQRENRAWKKEKESDEKFRYKVINWYYDDVAINPDDTD